MEQSVWWASESFWRKIAVWVTGVSFVILVFLTMDTLPQITAGGSRVPAYSAINHRIEYVQTDSSPRKVAKVRTDIDEPLFGKKLSEEEAEAMVSHGKIVTQAKNCMNCHTLLGNGAYYAPDLTKAWLDPAWGSKETREADMVAFLMDPTDKPHNSIGRRMPNLGITEPEARATVAFLKWMSSINTAGFPHNFEPIEQNDAPAAAPVAVPTPAAEAAPAAPAQL